MKFFINPLSANFTKWSNRLKQFVSKLPTNCFSVFGHFVGFALTGLRIFSSMWPIPKKTADLFWFHWRNPQWKTKKTLYSFVYLMVNNLNVTNESTIKFRSCLHLHISCHWSISIPPENVRNQSFQGAYKGRLQSRT